MDEVAVYRQDLLNTLMDVVNGLSTTVTSIPSNAWYASHASDPHTPHFILAHLRALEVQVFTNNLHHILAEDTRLLPVFDDEAWMAGHYQPGEAVQKILDELVGMRQQEVDWLRVIPASSWSRSARHPWWGVHTLQWWVELQLDYSQQQVKRINSFLAI